MSEPEGLDADLLIERYLAGQLTPEEAERLLQLLQATPELGAGLLDQLAVDALLRDVAHADRQISDVPRHSRPPWSRTRRIATWVAGIAASVLLILLVGERVLQGRRGAPATTTNEVEATTTAVAVLTRTVQAQWAEGSEAPHTGALLVPGELKLEAGLAQIEFFSGARVVLEGPAEFRLVSTNEGFCRLGRLTAEVPPQAQGFRVGTPQQDVVDRGTSFGVEVRAAGSEVHVFKGKVELHEKDAKREDLGEGEATAVEGGQRRRVAANAAVFVSAAELDQRVADAERRWRNGWRATGEKLNGDPSLIARFDFETAAGERSLPNVARSERGVRDGTVVGCGWVEGRWPGKRALEFRGVGDRVRLNLPGDFRSLTLAAWVRVNGLDRKFNSLLLTDGFDPGAVHWQIRSTGHLRLGVRGVGQSWHHDYDSPVVFTPERLGQWVYVAVTYNAAARRVTHYVDGRPVRGEATKAETPLRIGPAEIGNWTPGTRRDSTPIRNFSGRIDELSVYDRALSEDEIASLHRSGAGWDENR